MKRYLSVLVFLAFGALGCNGNAGPSLPNASEIKNMEITTSNTTMTVAKDSYSTILALFLSGSVDEKPKKWEILGSDLKIITQDGKIIYIWLYRTYAGAGAFSVGPTWAERIYYRGSTDEEIGNVIKGIQWR